MRKLLLSFLVVFSVVFGAGITVPTKNTADTLSAAEFSQLIEAARYGTRDLGPISADSVNTGGALTANKLVANGGNIVLNTGYLSGDGGNEGVYVSANGNVGLGTTAPLVKLHIKGLTQTDQLLLQDVSGTTYGHAGVFGDGMYLIGGGAYRSGWVNDDANKAIAAIQLQSASADSSIVFQTSAVNASAPTVRMTLDKSGNVGLGTTAPLALIHASKPDSIRLIISNTGAAAGAKNYYINVDGGAMTSGFGDDTMATVQNSFSVGYDGHVVVNDDSLASNFRVEGNNDANLLSVYGSTDRVGIGVLAPSTKLDVAGTVSASALQVNGTISCASINVLGVGMNVPDYVFEKDYNLMSISAMAKYVGINKHLPNVPSEKELKTNIDLGVLSFKLLEKIEEAHLYIIELEKRIKKLERRK